MSDAVSFYIWPEFRETLCFLLTVFGSRGQREREGERDREKVLVPLPKMQLLARERKRDFRRNIWTFSIDTARLFLDAFASIYIFHNIFSFFTVPRCCRLQRGRNQDGGRNDADDTNNEGKVLFYVVSRASAVHEIQGNSEQHPLFCHTANQ